MSLLHWHIGNVLFGNADGHAKNLSLVYRDGGCRLAPFHDLVCTAIYEQAGMRTGIVLRLLDDMSARLARNLAAMRDAFMPITGTTPLSRKYVAPWGSACAASGLSRSTKFELPPWHPPGWTWACSQGARHYP
jgi:hypothetical protein